VHVCWLSMRASDAAWSREARRGQILPHCFQLPKAKPFPSHTVVSGIFMGPSWDRHQPTVPGKTHSLHKGRRVGVSQLCYLGTLYFCAHCISNISHYKANMMDCLYQTDTYWASVDQIKSCSLSHMTKLEGMDPFDITIW